MKAICKETFFNFVDFVGFVKDCVYEVRILEKNKYFVIGEYGKPATFGVLWFAKNFKPIKKEKTK